MSRLASTFGPRMQRTGNLDQSHISELGEIHEELVLVVRPGPAGGSILATPKSPKVLKRCVSLDHAPCLAQEVLHGLVGVPADSAICPDDPERLIHNGQEVEVGSFDDPFVAPGDAEFHALGSLLLLRPEFGNVLCSHNSVVWTNQCFASMKSVIDAVS